MQDNKFHISIIETTDVLKTALSVGKVAHVVFQAFCPLRVTR